MEIKNKRAQTNIERTGYSTWNQNSELLDAYKQKNLETFGYEWPMQLPENQINLQNSVLQKYGVTNVFCLDSVKAKIIEYNLENYGVPYYVQTEECKEKTKRAFIDHYGVDHNMKSDIGKYEFTTAMQQKYGVDWAMQNYEIFSNATRRYTYDGKKFDSAPEIAFYIYLKDHNCDFEYQPQVSFEYQVNGKTLKYFPDFKVNDVFIEIKGLHFFKDKDVTKEMVNPFDHSYDYEYEAKHQCMIKNNVKILVEYDYAQYLDYVDITYGKEYLKQFKNSSNNESKENG